MMQIINRRLANFMPRTIVSQSNWDWYFAGVLEEVHGVQLFKSCLFLYYLIFSFDLIQLMQRIQEDEDQNPRFDVSKFKKNIRGATQKAKGQTSLKSLFIVIGAIVSILVLAAIAIKIHDLQKMVKALQHSSPASSHPTTQLGPPVTSQNVQRRIDELQKKVQSLSEKADKLQTDILAKGQDSSSKSIAKIQGINSTNLISYVDSRFQNHKTTINFLHMHSSEIYYYQKLDFLRSVLGTDLLRTYEKARVSFMQSFNNFKLPHSNIHIQNERRDLVKKEEERLSKEYDFSLPELPFCIVVPTLNNAKNFRYQYNLQSMINLDYKNFKIVIVDDASSDYTYDLIKLWIEENKVTHNIVVLTNTVRMTAVPNIHRAVTQHCDPKDIVVLVDGDDEMLGRYSLKVFNHVYQKNKADVVYSNHLQFYTHIKQVYRGWSMSYSDDEKRNNRYRDVPQRIAHLRSFKASLYLKIKEQDLKEKDGEWFKSTYDEVICLPILEMSCGRIVYLQEFFYLYNFGIGTNDLQVDQGLQKRIADEVKYRRTKYQCVNQ